MSKISTQAGLRLALTVAAGLAIAACASPGSDGGDSKSSWMDPMRSGSLVYTGVSPSAAESRSTLAAARVCCDSLSELRFEPLDLKASKLFSVDSSAQAFAFNSGKSFVRAFSIPDELERATVTLEAVAGATVFVPTVLLLDRDFQVTRAIDSDTFEYTPAGFMEPQRLRGQFLLDRRRGSDLAQEKYLVVFTTDKDLRGSTQMVSEARLYARVRGLADPRLPDPVAEHAATGVFRITVGNVETGARAPAGSAGRRDDADRYVAGAGAAAAKTTPTRTQAEPVPPTPPKAQTRSTTPGPGSEPMLRETQAMYDTMIRDAVASGNMDRAWRLVQEAERAGSTTARQTFLQAVEKKK
jgi:maltose operon periplasmic protein